MNIFNSYKIFLIFVFLGLTLQGCTCSRVQQGEIGLLVKNAGGEKGNVEEYGPGLQFYAPVAREFYRYPTFVQRAVWTKDKKEGSPTDQAIRVLTGNGMEYTLNVGLSWYVNGSPGDGCATALFRKYGKSPKEIEQTEIRDVVRTSIQSVFSRYDANYIYDGRQQIVSEINDEIKNSTLGEAKGKNGQQCFEVENFRLLGMNPPEQIRQAINDKLEAEQQAQAEKNQLQRQIYASRKDSVRATMDAKNNRIVAESISPELIEYMKAQRFQEKWDGKLPRVVTGGESSTMLNVGGQ